MNKYKVDAITGYYKWLYVLALFLGVVSLISTQQQVPATSDMIFQWVFAGATCLQVGVFAALFLFARKSKRQDEANAALFLAFLFSFKVILRLLSVVMYGHSFIELLGWTASNVLLSYILYWRYIFLTQKIRSLRRKMDES